MNEVNNYTCGECRYHNSDCRCIDHRYIHFCRPWFSCDVMTAHHAICSAFSPNPHYPAIYFDWHANGGWDGWFPLYIEQWHNGRTPTTIAIIKAKKPKEGREFSDDRYFIPYEDFIACNIMKPDGIHYTDYTHIERTRKNPLGYEWRHEGPGILTYEELEDTENG